MISLHLQVLCLNLKKIINEAGYKNKFTKTEREFWNEIFDTFITEDAPEGTVYIPGDKVSVE